MRAETASTVAKTARLKAFWPRRPERSASLATISASQPALMVPAMRITKATSARPERLTTWSMVLSREERPRALKEPATPVRMMPQKRTVPSRREGPPS